MKLPITKLKRAARQAGDNFSHVEVSLWPHKDNDSATPNMLLSKCEDICDVGYLAKNDVCESEDDLGLVKIELRLNDKEYCNVGYRELFVFDNEAYVKLPPHLSTELGRAVYLAKKNA